MCTAELRAIAALVGAWRDVRDGMGDANRSRMISNKTFNKILANVVAAMPPIPYVRRRRRSMVMPLVLGGIGVAIAGGIAAVMLLSPRTRYRALDVAKNTYGKISHGRRAQPLADGMPSEQGAGYASTGL